MPEFLASSSYFCLLLTLIAFSFTSAIQAKFKKAWLNPILLSALLIICILNILGVSNTDYQTGCKILSYLLTPATICLAIGFYEQYQKLKSHLAAIFAGVAAGGIGCLGCVYLMSRLFGLDRVLMLSMLPKSITAAIGVAVSEEIGGIAAITTVSIAFAGILGNIFAPNLCKLFGIREEIAMGVAAGTASHVIGTARINEISRLAGAVGSFSLTICGLMTALILSVTAQYL